jgi:hypothetical protein
MMTLLQNAEPCLFALQKPQVESGAEQAQAAAQQQLVLASVNHVKDSQATGVEVDGSKQTVADPISGLNGSTELQQASVPGAESSAGNQIACPEQQAGAAASIVPAAEVAAASPSQARAGAPDGDELALSATTEPPAPVEQKLRGVDSISRTAAASSLIATADGSVLSMAAEPAAAVHPPSSSPEAVTSQQQPAGSATGSLPCVTGAPGTTICNVQGSQSVQSALASGAGSKASLPPRSVKFAEQQQSSSADVAADAVSQPPRVSFGGSSSNGGGGGLDQPPRPRGRIPGRSRSSLNPRPHSEGGEISEAVLAKQADILRANKMGKLRQRRGGLDSSFAAMQEALATTEKPLAHVNTRVSCCMCQLAARARALSNPCATCTTSSTYSFELLLHVSCMQAL